MAWIHFPINSYLSLSSNLELHGSRLCGHAIISLTNYYNFFLLFPAFGCVFSITSNALLLTQYHMVVCICWRATVQVVQDGSSTTKSIIKARPVLPFATFYGSIRRFIPMGRAQVSTQAGWRHLPGWHPDEELLRGDLQSFHIFREWLACWLEKR